MPVCPRCGKILSSEQALSYHMNKKFKCGSLKCVKCGKSFDTKFKLGIHEMNCLNDRCNTPSFDLLRLIFVKSDICFFELDHDNVIKNMSPFAKKKHGDLLGCAYESSDSDQIITHNDTTIIVKY